MSGLLYSKNFDVSSIKMFATLVYAMPILLQVNEFTTLIDLNDFTALTYLEEHFLGRILVNLFSFGFFQVLKLCNEFTWKFSDHPETTRTRYS